MGGVGNARAPDNCGEFLRGERVPVVLALAGVTAIAWLYLFIAGQDMDIPMAGMAGMPDMAMPFAAPWVFAMWWVMMLGMMLPSAAPMILMYATLQRRKRERGQSYVPAMMFVVGYLFVWGAFSVAATAAQWLRGQQGALLSPALALANPVWGGVLFILAGIYQLTPFKYACLSHCRSPFAFVLNHWRDGSSGALRMGASHGLVLPRLLLGSHGAAVRGGRDRGVRVRRETAARRHLGRSHWWRGDGSVRGVAAVRISRIDVGCKGQGTFVQSRHAIDVADPTGV